MHVKNKAQSSHQLSKGPVPKDGMRWLCIFSSKLQSLLYTAWFLIIILHQRSKLSPPTTDNSLIPVKVRCSALSAGCAQSRTEWLTKAKKPKQVPGGGPRQHRGAGLEPPGSPSLRQQETSRGQRLAAVSQQHSEATGWRLCPSSTARPLSPENCMNGRFQPLPWLSLKPFSGKLSEPSRHQQLTTD